MGKVLILKFGAIGDVIMAIPAAHELHLRGHKIDWVCGMPVEPILRLYPWIRPIVIDDRALLLGRPWSKAKTVLKLWRALDRRRYDLAATLYYDRRYRALTLFVRAERTLLLSQADRRFRLLPGRHHTDEFARILLDLPDGRRPIPLPPIPVSTSGLLPSILPRGPRIRIVLAPAGARNLLADDVLRRWPPELYRQLAEMLLQAGSEVVLIGGPGDAWVQPLFTGVEVMDLIGELTLPQTLALLHAADILVTHDTGPLHLGGITPVGIIALFGPTDPHGRLPQRPGTVALWGGEGFACRPCYDGHSFAPCPANDCMAQITPEMVFGEVAKMLVERDRGYLAPPRVTSPKSTIPSAKLVQIGGEQE